MVNGEPITDFDIEQRMQARLHLPTHKQPTRQEVINELIDEKVKIKEAKKFGVDPASSDIDQAYAGDEPADADHAGSVDADAGEARASAPRR